MPHISLAAEIITRIAGFPISNALITTWLVMGILIVMSYLATRQMSLVPSQGQSIAEMLVGGLYDFFASVTGKHVSHVFPLVASLFLFILAANWVGLLPGVGTVGLFRQVHEGEEFVPLLRGATADLNTTVALAVFAMVAIQYFGFKTAGIHYSKRFLNFDNPIYFFLGILELVSEVSKVVSFAFRLFGNIFAGEVLLTVMAFLMPFVVPLPFIAMELFVGFIQALVFSMLTAVFLSVAVSHGEHEKLVAEGGGVHHG
ncbi:F0F1 ATP synthase subunit A [Candidatus Gottesmanbacteria bacterium]|nr:F0F1 ATP synthase subunit A [Candidatus Gottesmanbacteria bacterium]